MAIIYKVSIKLNEKSDLVFGTVVNSIAVIVGGLMGLLLGKGIKEDSRNTLMDGIGLSLMVIGITSGIKSENVLLLVSSIVIGAMIGERVNIEKRLDNMGNSLQSKFGKEDSQFSKAFVTAFLVCCAGAMSIVGSIESGIDGNHTTLLVKSILDGVLCLLLASTMGVGVLFAAIPVFIYQAILTLIASGVGDLLTPAIVNEMSSVGGMLIIAIGINVLELKKIRVANMIPAIFIPVIYFIMINLFNFI